MRIITVLLMVGMEPKVVKITKKGQATIPKVLREKFGLKDKTIAIETEGGVLLKPLPEISAEKGSLKGLFGDETAGRILKKVREEDIRKEKRLKLR